ncbi:MAG: hypothetical protein CMJ68_20825 [Planctomycetaceae bacterium]|nr:hypothetical protein [Planctomycetaceae bacterium]
MGIRRRNRTTKSVKITEPWTPGPGNSGGNYNEGGQPEADESITWRVDAVQEHQAPAFNYPDLNNSPCRRSWGETE